MTAFSYLTIIVILSAIREHSPASTLTSSTSTPNNKIRLVMDLPPDIHRIFNLTIRFPFFHKVSSALIVFIVNKTNTDATLLEKFEFRPGSETQLNVPFRGKYMHVPLCKSLSSNRSMELHIQFNITAQNSTLLIYYSENYQPQFWKPTASQIYESRIFCNVSSNPNISLTIGTNDADEEAFFVDQNIWINCSATTVHEPRWRHVQLEGLDHFDILNQFVANVTFKSSIYTSTTIKNHGDQIVCRSMSNFNSRMILIYHPPDFVYTVPKINSWASIPYNVSITCHAKGGYPPPTVKWKMIIGPINASIYYSMTQDRTVLLMHDTAPPGSKWIFDCTATNTIPPAKSSERLLRVYSNVAELSIERRRIVVIVVPIFVVIVVVLICLLKGYCFKTNKKKTMKTFLFEMPQFKASVDILETYQDSKKPLSNDVLSENSSSSTYSIETGIGTQSVNLLDGRCGARATSKSLPNDVSEITLRHNH